MRLSTANASRWRVQPGHYEVWHLRLGDPHSAASAWIRHSFHVPPEAAPGESTAELWFVGRAPDGAAYARRQSFSIDQFRTGAGGFPLTLGPSSLDVASASGRVDEARWDRAGRRPASRSATAEVAAGGGAPRSSSASRRSAPAARS